MSMIAQKVFFALISLVLLQFCHCDSTTRARLFGEGASFLSGLEGPTEVRVARSLASSLALAPTSSPYGGYGRYGYYPTYAPPAYAQPPVVSYGSRPLTYNYSPAPAPPAYGPTSGFIAPVPIPVYGSKVSTSSLQR